MVAAVTVATSPIAVVPIEVPVIIPAALEAGKVFIAPYASIVPASRDPVAVGPVSADPGVSHAGARRNISNRPADVDSELGRLGRCRSQTESTHDHRRTEHPLAHAFHRTSIPPDPRVPAKSLSGFYEEAWILLPRHLAGYVLFKHLL